MNAAVLSRSQLSHDLRIEICDLPAGVCLTEAGFRAVYDRYLELGRRLTAEEVRKLLAPARAYSTP